ncbi:DUF692 domain-containing protein [Mycobacteroides abscessus]|uniref:DUF692 domain-containing protein n=1 Tax=Mycobacteroides abscessus TaxID=36809 RepID=UPI000C2564C0|nr:DUF692 domain-containing protein [Mycobacteroides abscessus]
MASSNHPLETVLADEPVVGACWRPELAAMFNQGAVTDDSLNLAFTEIVAENFRPGELPAELTRLREAGTVVVPHGVSLGLAGADLPDAKRVKHLAALAAELNAPMVSEHVAFVRAGFENGRHSGVLEAGHLLAPPRTTLALDVLVDNVSRVQDDLGVPLVLENVATTLQWPENELSEADYLRELSRRTECWLVLDIPNLYATAVASGTDPIALLRRFPLERVAYVHIAGGRFEGDLYWDTHADTIIEPVADLLTELVALTSGRSLGVLIERDGSIDEASVSADLSIVRQAIKAGVVHA